MARDVLGFPVMGRQGKVRKPVTSGLKSQVLSRSRGRCERCGKDVIRRGLKPRYHHKDGNPSHNTLSNILLLCNDCHDKVHVYRTKSEYHPIYGRTTRKVLVTRQIKKRGRKKRIRKKKPSSMGIYNPLTGRRERRKRDSFGWDFS
jgi:hypothetical protein